MCNGSSLPGVGSCEDKMLLEGASPYTWDSATTVMYAVIYNLSPFYTFYILCIDFIYTLWTIMHTMYIMSEIN